MTRLFDIPFSILDLAPIVEGGSASGALKHSLDLARHAESWGYHRFWLAEHHSMPGIASAATSLVIAHVAAGTSSIRVGSGGIMLANHAPLMIAEQFGTLESLYPGRIDLGLGRAPGTDQATVRFLRRGLNSTGEEFPEQLAELRAFLAKPVPHQRVQAVPGAGLDKIPIYLLGSGGFSARLAGELGLPFASAGHFSPGNLLPGLKLYRDHFVPSRALKKPYALVCINVFAAENDEEARRLATSQRQAHLALRRGMPVQLPPPASNWQDYLPDEADHITSTLASSITGSPATVHKQLQELLEETQADELMIHSMIYDHPARLRCYEIVKELRK